MDLKEKEVFYPWRRFFARTFDSSIYQLVWSFIMAFCLHINLLNRNSILEYLDVLVGLLIMLFLEPLLLRLFGTTLGKFIFGLHFENKNGSYPSYKEGFVRTWKIIGWGFGYGIPIVHLVMLWKSYQRCKEREVQPWEDEIDYELVYWIKDRKWYRGFVYVLAEVVLICVSILPGIIGIIPPNRGNLTVAEFAENYNTLADYYNVDNGKYMNPDGKLEEKEPEDDGVVHVTTLESLPEPTLDYKVENGKLTKVQFTIKSNNHIFCIDNYSNEMMITFLSFATSHKFSQYYKMRKELANVINNHSFQDFKYKFENYNIVCDVNYSGYELGGDYLISISDKGPYNFETVFSITKK